MALPLLLGLGGSALAGSLGANALLYGAVGSGLGSLLQGDDLGTAIGTGMLSYFGGKALSGLGGAGGAGVGAEKMASPAAFTSGAPGSLQGNVLNNALDPTGAARLLDMAAPTAASTASTAATTTPSVFNTAAQNAAIPKVGLEGALSAIKSPSTLGALGTTGLIEASKPPKMDDMSEDYPDIPEAEAARRKRNPILPGYRPGIDPEMPYFTYAQGGEVQKPNDKEIISDAVDAIKGTNPDPQRALALFVATYGDDALRDLVGRVRSGEFDENAQVTEGMVEGIGDGMDDMIPATLEGEQDVVLSDGEFIVPADVVSGLGNGSTDAGAKSLYEMMDRVRQMRTGMTEQPDQVPQGMMLPA